MTLIDYYTEQYAQSELRGNYKYFHVVFKEMRLVVFIRSLLNETLRLSLSLRYACLSDDRSVVTFTDDFSVLIVAMRNT